MKFYKISCRFLLALFFLLLTGMLTTPGFCAKKQFVPQLTITEEYTDNFSQTKNNKDDEFSTRYKAGFSFGVIDKKTSFFLDYNPQYTDYMDKNEYDGWDHNASVNAVHQISKNTKFTFSDTFNRILSRTVRTNSLEKQDTNTAMAAVNHQFGEKDFFNVSYTYSFNDYDNPSQDEFKSHRPAAYISYWFSPHYGFDLNASYSKTDYEISSNDPETLRGNLRFLKNINRHLDAYVKYAHTYTTQDLGDHVVYNPSIGFDWKPAEDSGIVLGGGMLFQDYDKRSNYDSQKFFLEFDVYKNFSFSKRNNLSITGSSSYNDIDEEASSLGFSIHYQAGFLHTYRLTKTLSSKLNGSYRITEYDDPGVNREDQTMNLGTGLVWSPMKWLKLNLSYGLTDFNSTGERDDYQEQKVIFSINLIPKEPLRMQSYSSRQALEDEIF